MGPNVLSGSLNDIISRDSVTVYDLIVERELESLDGSTPDLEMKYVNLMKNADVETCSYPRDCDHNYSTPAKGLVAYIAMESPIPETVL